MSDDSKTRATAIIDAMMYKDYFSQWLGIERMEEKEGYCKLRMTVRREMCNGFEIAHGGISYSLADSALAFASNSHGRQSVSVETSISHIKPLKAGDIITATAEEKSRTNKIAIYDVRIEKESGELAALFKGTVFRKETEWNV
ncbi:hydroxyphenylacetyl-CoA thioesterase PaaI [Longitalea luteola]|uniref:hydroxyphenylacetyl-CoA thioesterase PaaI n=1 Tax=Longitalea luteola TaxID=2812563 RepID=UPI001A969A37|nr:hydroxyphenylacetyl-CoA thioesterase PaaI [Longitalea luteola]